MGMTSMKLESLKLPAQVIDVYQETAKELGVTRAFVTREVLIDYVGKLKEGKYPKRMRAILDIGCGNGEETGSSYS